MNPFNHSSDWVTHSWKKHITKDKSMHNNKPNKFAKRIEEVCNWIILKIKTNFWIWNLKTWTLKKKNFNQYLKLQQIVCKEKKDLKAQLETKFRRKLEGIWLLSCFSIVYYELAKRLVFIKRLDLVYIDFVWLQG